MVRANLDSVTSSNNMADQLISPSVFRVGIGPGCTFHCCVPLCSSDSRYDTGVNFHRIPQDKALKKKWIVKIRRDEGKHFKISKSTVVCSNHFTPEDYRWTPVRRCLKRGVVPSVFPWTLTRDSDKPPRRVLKRELANVDD